VLSPENPRPNAGNGVRARAQHGRAYSHETPAWTGVKAKPSSPAYSTARQEYSCRAIEFEQNGEMARRLRIIPFLSRLGCIWLFLVHVSIASERAAKEAEIADLQEKLSQILPKNWVVKEHIYGLEIIGPEVLALNPISLPGSASDQEIWREYAIPLKIHLSIHFQERLPDKDLAELRRMRDRFRTLTEQAANRQLKEWDNTIKEYGYIRLPDFQSAEAAIFFNTNTSGFLIRQEEALAGLGLIKKELAARFSQLSDK
jgi:hypothetical protein